MIGPTHNTITRRKPTRRSDGAPRLGQTATHQLLDQRPDGPEWLHESKFDGYLVFNDDVKGLTCCLLPFCYKTVGNASAAEVAGAPNSTESAAAARAVDVHSFDASTHGSDCR